MKIVHDDKFYVDMIQKYSDTVYRLACSLTKSRFDADDIYQEVFIRYVKKKPEFQNPEHEKAWFLRVTINCCKNFWKSPWMKRRSMWEEGEQAAEEPTEEQDREESLYLLQTVQKLPIQYRAVIHLFYYEEMSVEEIGKITGAKVSTVRTRLTRARRMLKERLKEEEEN